jgi:two-component system, OmpR family, KDP operon response regulator KdpE
MIRTPAFTIDLAAKKVTRDGRDIRLTPTEWHLLEVLARTPGRLVGHQQLLGEVWGPAYLDQTNYLRVYVGTLRRKLEPDPGAPAYLLTEPGIGYRLNV